MKTQISSKKAIGATLLALLISGGAFAQSQSSMANDETSNNMTFVLCVLLFIVGFAILIMLKIRDDRKNPKHHDMSGHRPHILHRNHYGHGKHQYHH